MKRILLYPLHQCYCVLVVWSSFHGSVAHSFDSHDEREREGGGESQLMSAVAIPDIQEAALRSASHQVQSLSLPLLVSSLLTASLIHLPHWSLLFYYTPTPLAT